MLSKPKDSITIFSIARFFIWICQIRDRVLSFDLLVFLCFCFLEVFKCGVYFFSCFVFVSLLEAAEKKWKDFEGKNSGSVLSSISPLSVSASLIILVLH